MNLSITTATVADDAEITLLRNLAAEHLTRQYGRGHWSSHVTEASVLRGIASSRVLIGRSDSRLIATLRLATKKPWAIDPKYFVAVRRPLYLHEIAIDPELQRHGVGRRLIEEAKMIATRWPSDAIRLDAYDGAMGAGAFYAKCGFREVGRATYRRVPLVYFELLL